MSRARTYDEGRGAVQRAVFASAGFLACVLAVSFSSPVQAGGKKKKRTAEKEEAAAVEKEDDAAAKHFEAGVRLFLERRFEESAAQFKKAHAINRHWAVRFNIASCYMEIGKYAEAAQELWLFLEEGKDMIDEGRRQEAMGLIEKALKSVAKIRIEVDQEDAVLFIDGEKVEWPENGQAVTVNPGVHNIEVGSEGMESWKSKVELKAGEEYAVEAVLGEKGGSKGRGKRKSNYEGGRFVLEGARGLRGGDKETYAGPLLEEKRISKHWFWISTGALVATTLAAVAMTVMTKVTKNELDDLYDEYDERERQGTLTMEYYRWASTEREDLLDKGKTYSDVQAVMWIGAGFFAAATLTLSIFTFRRERPQSKVGMLLMRGGAGLSLSF